MYHKNIKENEDQNWDSSNKVNGSGSVTTIKILSLNFQPISSHFTILIIQDDLCLSN